MSEETKKETEKSTKAREGSEIPKKFKEIVKQIEEMTVLELSELVKILEERFGVTAAVPVVSGVASATPSEVPTEKEEYNSFNIELISAGDQKINVIKVIREITTLGLKEAKDLVDSAPKIIKENVKKEEAEEIKKKLEAAGAKVELK